MFQRQPYSSRPGLIQRSQRKYSDMGLTRIKHPSHSHHYLCLLKLPQEPYWCNGCMGLGFGPCYECEHEGCGFYLHEECANAAPSISHPFSKCSLKFHYNAPQGDERYCDACGEDVLGFVYQCTHKHPHDYHPRCLKLPLTLTTGDGLRLQLRKKLPSKCLRCGSKETSNRIQGWCYVSSSDRYCYHIACVKDMILEKWRKGYFTQDGDVNKANNLALQTFNPGREIALPGGRSSSKATKLWRKAATVIMVIISALFGDPSALISVLVQNWLSS